MRHLSKLVAKWTVTKKEINSCQIKWQQRKKSPNTKLNCCPMKCIVVTGCPTIQLQIESHWRMRFERYFWCGYNWKAGEMHQKMNYAFNQNLFWANCVSLENFSHNSNTPSWNVWLPMKAGLAKALKSSIFLSGSVIVSHLRSGTSKQFCHVSDRKPSCQTYMLSCMMVWQVWMTYWRFALRYFLTFCRDQKM